MKLISWNVNGIRAWAKKENTFDWIFEKEKPDFFCVQETKAHPEQLPDDIREPEGYFSYFDYSRLKKGYSGVAIYAKHEPDFVEDSMDSKNPDQEGRFLALFYDGLVIINCYFPNGGGGDERLKYKLDFYQNFLKYIEKQKKKGLKIIFCGDLNVAHEEIDIARPKENKNSIGFLPVERAWVDQVIKKGYVDTWRSLNNEKVQYSWWDMKTRARDRNIGWRIDYFFVSENLKNEIKKAKIHDDIYGSDHCPISLEIS